MEDRSDLSREITVLVMPPVRYASWRMTLRVRHLAVLLAVWSVLTVWAGAMAARRLDYAVTKGENSLMRARLQSLASQVELFRGDVERTREADRKLRELLGMPSRRKIFEEGSASGSEQAPAQVLAAPPGPAGGPMAADRLELVRSYARTAGLLEPQPRPAATAAADDLERAMAELSRETDRAAASLREIDEFIELNRARLRATPSGWPARGWLSSYFGYRLSPMQASDDGNREHHGGLDIAHHKGTPIVATADGVVAQAGWRGGYGQMVMLRHGFGYATLFGHASRLLVRAGQRVRRGQTIALMGSTGRSTGSHLHYEVWVNGRPANPAKYLKPTE